MNGNGNVNVNGNVNGNVNVNGNENVNDGTGAIRTGDRILQNQKQQQILQHTWYYVFANELAKDFAFVQSDLHDYDSDSNSASADAGAGANTTGAFVSWEYGSATVTKMGVGRSIVLTAGKKGDYGAVRFFRLSPTTTSGFSVVGEPGKFVGVARQRFACFSEDPSKIVAAVIGAPDEVVEIVIADASLRLHTAQCKLSSQGKAQLQVSVADGKITCQ
jgi:hypothetical protein